MKYHNHVLNNKCRPRDSLLLLNRIGKKNKKNELFFLLLLFIIILLGTLPGSVLSSKKNVLSANL